MILAGTHSRFLMLKQNYSVIELMFLSLVMMGSCATKISESRSRFLKRFGIEEKKEEGKEVKESKKSKESKEDLENQV